MDFDNRAVNTYRWLSARLQYLPCVSSLALSHWYICLPIYWKVSLFNHPISIHYVNPDDIAIILFMASWSHWVTTPDIYSMDNLPNIVSIWCQNGEFHYHKFKAKENSPMHCTSLNQTVAKAVCGTDRHCKHFTFYKPIISYPIKIRLTYQLRKSRVGLRRQTTMLVSCSQCFWKGCICFISVYFHFFFSPQV